MSFDEKIDALIKRLPKLLEDLGTEIVIELQNKIAQEMGGGSVSKDYAETKEAFPDSETTFSNSKILRRKSGALLKSFGVHAKGTSIKATKNKLKVKVESDKIYARVHEEGGFIKAKLGINKHGKPVYNGSIFLVYVF